MLWCAQRWGAVLTHWVCLRVRLGYSFLTRQRLKRAAMRAKEQAATVAYLILRAQALAAANMTLNLVLEQVPAVVALRKQALTRAATVWRCRCRLFAPLSADSHVPSHRSSFGLQTFSRNIVNDSVQKLHERGVPLELLAIRRIKKNLARRIVKVGKARAFHVLNTARRSTRKIMKRAVSKARTWIINKVVCHRLLAGRGHEW